ncbi:hypothetical protein [Clostridium sp.]|uniref:hypothetical protein n=1 Tax=Clostridium sp. TaxID=1506 RepID=UPI002605AC38|nr:hypothetical protein [Clostridium sp.]
MFDNKCFCESCNKLELFKIKKDVVEKEFNIGKIRYEKLIGFCNVCNNEVYSLDLFKKNKKELESKIRAMEEEMKMLKLIEGAKTINFANLSNEEIEQEIEKMILRYNKK